MRPAVAGRVALLRSEPRVLGRSFEGRVGGGETPRGRRALD